MARAERDWQKIDPHLRQHPAFHDLVESLDSDAVTTHGLLAGLWAFAFTFARDGNVGRFTPRRLARSIGWKGDPDLMVEALIDAGFLEPDDDALAISDWSEWGGALFAERTSAARRSADYRQRKRVEQGETSCDETSRVTGVTQEEKRRERQPKSIDGFDDFWKAYPNKQSKVPARKTWASMTRDDRIAAYRAAKRMSQAVESGFRERDKCPHGATFLNQRRWEDWFDEDGKPIIPTGYGPPEGLRHDRTTEDNRITCWVCGDEVTADDMEDARFTEKKGWRHVTCTPSKASASI